MPMPNWKYGEVPEENSDVKIEVLKVIGHDLKVTESIWWFQCLREALSFLTIPRSIAFLIPKLIKGDSHLAIA